MNSLENLKRHEYSKFLYLVPFAVFWSLLELRDSKSYGFIFEVLPVLGRTLPYLLLTALITAVYLYRGGTLAKIGWCWPEGHKTKLKKIVSILLWAFVILVLRIVVAVVLDPVLESFPEHQSRVKMYLLRDNIGLLLILLPLMWLIVMGEEVLIRGFLIHYILRVVGETKMGWCFAIIISSLIFGLFHAGKGPAALISSGFAGLVFGLGFYFRKNLWPVIVAHSAGNTLGFLSAYFSGED